MKSERLDAYLAALGSPTVEHTVDGLARLQQAHLRAVPFHNLLLLANQGRPFPLQPLEAVIDHAIEGVGGNCDRTTPPFIALLTALGFDATLIAATVNELGDHFAGLVTIDGQRFLCDVGNGHPYLDPWNLDGGTQTRTWLGWTFRFEPNHPHGPTLFRQLPTGWKRVYTVHPLPQPYGAFEGIVRAHYTRPGFGPFFSSLRAVRLTDHALLTLRDHAYGRDSRLGRSTRRLVTAEALHQALTGPFRLHPPLVADALSVLERRKPALFARPSWVDQVDLPVPLRVDRADVPDILVSVATIGRPEALKRLLTTLDQERRASGYPGRVGVLVVHNHDEGPPEGTDTVHHVPIGAAWSHLERTAELGLLPAPNALPLPIGSAREAQLAILRAHFDAPRPGLPHPADHPTVVWMLDDDMAFAQHGPNGVTRSTHLLFRVARAWATLPEQAVVLGTYTGDPPIPALDGLGGQLDDLTRLLRDLASVTPDSSWNPSISRRMPEDYYDLATAPPSGARGSWLVSGPAREVALDLICQLPRLLDGQQLTRPLVWDGIDHPPRSSVRRGGNTVFLDLDALFRWPTPVLGCADGVQTRRADTIWATLAGADDPAAVREITLPLLHGRAGQRPQLPRRIHADALTRRATQATTAQVRGTALARAVACGDPEQRLRRREQRVTEHRQELVNGLERLELALCGLHVWDDAQVDAAVERAKAVVHQLRLRSQPPTPGDPSEFTAFLDRLPTAIQAWRQAW